MSKKIIILLALGAMLTLNGCGISGEPEQSSAESLSQNNSQTEEPYAANIEKHVDNNITIEYPQVKGLRGKLDTVLNERFKTEAMLYKNQVELGQISSEKDNIETKCEIKTQSADILSIFTKTYSYIHDAAYPDFGIKTYNINPQTGMDVTLKDVGNVNEYARNIYNGEKFTVVNKMGEGVDATAEVKKFLSDKSMWYSTVDKIETELNEYNLFYIENSKTVIILSVPHALGNYVELLMD